MKNGGKKVWVLVLVLLAGVLIFGVLWELLAPSLPASLNKGITIGTTSAPLSLNLSIVELTFGFKLRINPGSVVGLVAGLVIFFWRR